MIRYKAMAESMGGGIGELRELGAEGRIRADIIVNAMLEAGDELDRPFAATQMTVSQAMTNLRTACAQAMG